MTKAPPLDEPDRTAGGIHDKTCFGSVPSIRGTYLAAMPARSSGLMPPRVAMRFGEPTLHKRKIRPAQGTEYWDHEAPRAVILNQFNNSQLVLVKFSLRAELDKDRQLEYSSPIKGTLLDTLLGRVR